MMMLSWLLRERDDLSPLCGGKSVSFSSLVESGI